MAGDDVFFFSFFLGGRVLREYRVYSKLEEGGTREGARRVWREKVMGVHVILCSRSRHGMVAQVQGESIVEMSIETSTVPLTLPPSADPSKFSNFGRQVIGVDPGNLSPSDFAEIQQLLYKVTVLTRPTLPPRKPKARHGPLELKEYSLILSSSSTTPCSSET